MSANKDHGIIIASIWSTPQSAPIDLRPAVQLDGMSISAPLLTPEEADRLADDLMLAADAARQAAQDGYVGPAVVLALEIGVEAPVDHQSPEWCASADALERSGSRSAATA